MEGEKELTTKNIHHEEIFFSWEAPEFLEHERDLKWYISAGILALGLLAYSLYTKDWFFVVVIIILIIILSHHLRVKPKIRTYGIARTGIYVDKRFYSYDQIHSFWIVYQPPVKTINILFSKGYLPPLTIQLEDQDPVLIKNILKKFIPEQEKRGESFWDKTLRILKF